jgi:hypothetical protein
MSLPEKYWHCQVELLGGAATSAVYDLCLQDLQREVINPWCRETSFTINGLIVRARSEVAKILVAQTPHPRQYYAERAKERARGHPVFPDEIDWLTMSSAQDYTHDLLFASLGVAAPAPEVALILQLCRRLPAAARILAKGRRKGKVAFEITDEYDAQDLLHAVLRAYLKYTVHEEPLGKVGGGHAGRADVALEELGTVIELKYVHGPDDQRRIVDEFSNDLLLYTKWPHLKHFIYLVYNAQDLRDPEALDKLAGPCSLGGVDFTAHVVRA